MNIEEIFYSFSKKNVIRGFHFQNPPFDLDKLVWVTEGAILDVVLDIRKGSLTYGQHHSVEISAGNKKMVYMSKGIAHAFLTLSENATVFYATSKIFSKEHDTGIKWDTVGFRWPVDEPVISGKDDNLVSFKDFQSPFEMVNIQ
jgi:dTDP-4-dehydrorhamnose 3,5-epimerase